MADIPPVIDNEKYIFGNKGQITDLKNVKDGRDTRNGVFTNSFY